MPGGHCLVLLVRTDLKMSKGKVAAQVAHATAGLMCRYRVAPQDVAISLKCPSESDLDAAYEWLRTRGYKTHLVVDAGYTQVAPGSKTVLACYGREDDRDLEQFRQQFKLL
ncbi:MAG: hypothetical protein CMK92_02390 [Pseudomonas sp.]|nr:hypothetical protein [Pseudomonas sp.]